MGWESPGPVVVPIDFSGQSVAAISAAQQMAAESDFVHVVHVVPTLDQIVPGAEPDWHLPSDTERRDSVQQHFSDFLGQHGFENLRQVVLDGDPGVQIAEYAEQVQAGVIVIPSHGYHGLTRLLLGSVAESVIRRAHCPVFVLRRKDAD